VLALKVVEKIVERPLLRGPQPAALMVERGREVEAFRPSREELFYLF